MTLIPGCGRAEPRFVAAFALAIAIAIAVVLTAPDAGAADFYVDPAAGSPAGDGSQGDPWQTLAEVVSSGHVGSDIHAGDTVWLKAGYHGAVSIRGGDYDPPITLVRVSGEKPELARVSFADTHGWVLDGASISPSYAPAPEVSDLVRVDDGSSNVTVRNCDLFSVEDASAWGAAQWIDDASSGVSVGGDHVVVSRNTLRNVRFGISVDGPNALVEYNRITGFSADGLRGLGDFGVFQYNVVKDVYVSQDDGDDNHDDGFQSWSLGPAGPGDGVVRGVVLRGNVIVNREDPNQPLSNSLQGIGCFDGFFDDWVVENNVVVTDHWHGISLYGTRNTKILNNTVIDVNDQDPGPPWIMVNAHKDGRPSENVIVRNNLATDFTLEGTGIVDDHNTTLTDLSAYFVDPARFDLHLLPNAPAVNTGTAEGAPALDADRIPRPQGAGVDLGAYEAHDPSVTAPDGGAPPEPSSGGASAAGGGPGSAGAPGGAGGAPGNPSGGRSGAGAPGVPGAGGAPRGGPGAAGSSGAGAPAGGGGAAAGDDGGAGTAGGHEKDSGGCGCRVASRSAPYGVAAALAALALATGRRRSGRSLRAASRH